MRSYTILSALALLLVAFSLLLWKPLARAARAGEPPEELPEILDGARATSELRPAVQEAAPSTGPSRSDQREVQVSPVQGVLSRIRVVDTSGAPLPGARVWIQRWDVEDDSPAFWSAMKRFKDLGLALEAGLGDEVSLDERAEASVPRPTRQRLVAAARGDMHGEAILEAGAAECVVELENYHAVTFEVVDRADRPISGASVQLYWGESDPLDHLSTWTADAEGRVSLPKLEKQIGLEEYRGTIQASLAAGIQGEPEVARFTLDSIPADPIRFKAGDFGRVVLQLADARGEELALDGKAYLALQVEELVDPSLALRASQGFHSVMSGGRALFSTVGLGLPLLVMIAVDGHEMAFRDGVPGPTEPGQELRVLVPLGKQLARALGRVHGIRKCFGETPLSGVLVTGRSTRSASYFAVNVEEGELFDCRFPAAAAMEELNGPWILELAASGKPPARVTVEPAIDEPLEIVDFGDVRFEPMPEIARVFVRDASDAAVPYAGVEIESQSGASQLGCDGAGLCLVAGLPAELPLRVRARHSDLLPSAWERIDVPGSQVTLVVRPGTSILGQLLLPPGADPENFEIRLHVEPDEPGLEAQELVAMPMGEERFQLAPCPSGRATLAVHHLDGGAVFERPGIELEPGQLLELEPIDLRESLRSFALTFELASGEPWRGGHFQVREPAGQLSTMTLIGASGRAAFFAPRPSADLWVAALGARATLFEGVLDGDRITLPPSPSVRLRLPTGIRLPRSPLVLLARSSQESDEGREFQIYDDLDTEPAVVAEDGSAWLRVARPGRYELRWFVRHTGTGIDFEVKRSQAQTVEVTDTSAVPVVEAELLPDEVMRALRNAGG